MKLLQIFEIRNWFKKENIYEINLIIRVGEVF